MFLLEPGHTAYDLHWRMFGISVRVHPMFWLVAAIMGFGALQVSVVLFLAWIGCVFFSILVHELGHVCMFRFCGTSAHVVLYAFGGLAVPHHRLHNRWQRIAVSFAGPFAGFLVIGVIACVLAVMDLDALHAVFEYVLAIFGRPPQGPIRLEMNPVLKNVVFDLVWINLFWGLLNLLPIFPLDGGQISRDFLDGVMQGGQGTRTALGISLVCAGVLAVHSVAAAHGRPLIPFLPPLGTYGAIMFGMLAIQSFQLLQYESNPPWRRED
jgi:Zn-dependent protease